MSSKPTRANRLPTTRAACLSAACLGLAVAFPTATRADDGAGPLEEIVVRAQKRDQSLQDVPLALTVLAGDFLEQHRLQRLESVVLATPGLSGWEQGVSTPIFALRGISSNSFGVGGEASVGVFIDETYRGRINSTSLTLVDVEQVEVLKGPQGTLFGRNASAGAILVRRNLPDAEQSLDLTVEAGDNDYVGLEATANLPLADDWALRFSGFSYDDDGDLDNTWLDRDLGGRDTEGGQVALRYSGEPAEVILRLGWQQTRTGGLSYETLDPDLAAAGGVRPDPFDNVLALDTRTYDDVESYDASLHIHWPLGENLRFTSITAWHDNDSPNLFDVDGSAIFLTTAGFTSRSAETLSQEFRLHGSSGRLDWVGGILLFDEDIDTTVELGYSDTNRLTPFGLCEPALEPFLGPCQDSVLEKSSQSGDYFSTGVFADVSWLVNADLTLGAGLRYSYDDKEFEYRNPPVTSVIGRLNASELNPSGNLLGFSTDGWEKVDEDWDDWQPRVYANWQFTDGHNAFANLARGYKAGGFDPAATPELSVFDPEKVWNLDLGVRGAWPGLDLTYQLTGFVYDYEDYQVQVIENGIAQTGNADGVDGHGVEVELTWTPVPRVTLGFNGSWLDAEFKEYETDEGNFEGNRPILSPEYSASASLNWRSREFAWGSLGANLLSSYQSEVYFTVQNTDDARQDSYYRHDARLSYFAVNDAWQVDLFARNLFDEDYRIFEQDVGAGPVSRRGEPRFWGVSVTARF
jgi:iron complex outermembrane receptor protein